MCIRDRFGSVMVGVLCSCSIRIGDQTGLVPKTSLSIEKVPFGAFSFGLKPIVDKPLDINFDSGIM